jgi:hypothetical protein
MPILQYFVCVRIPALISPDPPIIETGPATARMRASIICITFVRFLLLSLHFSKNHKIDFVNRLSEINDFLEIKDRSPV